MPSRPAVPSATTAKREVDRWMAENDYRRLVDASGLAWETTLSVQLVQDGAAERGVVWELSLQASAQVTGSELVQRGTLDGEEDRRLLDLLGECRVPLVMRPLSFRATSEEELRRVFVERAPELRRKVEGARYDEVKRSLVGTFLAKRFRFDTEK